MAKGLEEITKEKELAKKEEEIIKNSFLDSNTLFETISLGYDFIPDCGDGKPSNKYIFQNDKARFHLGHNKRDSVYFFTLLPLEKTDQFTENRLFEIENNDSYEFSRFKTTKIFKKGKEEYRFVKDKDTGNIIMGYSSERREVLCVFTTLALFYGRKGLIAPKK